MSRMNRRRKAVQRKVLRLKPLLNRLLQGVAVLAVSGLLLAGGWWLNQALSVHSWQISGVAEPLEIAVEKQLNAMKPLDFLHAWPSRLRRQLLDNVPDLADVNIARKLPDRLLIQATPRLPVALWQGAAGEVLLVDGHGEAYRALLAGEMLDLPLLRVAREEIQESVVLLLLLKQKDMARYANLSEWLAAPDGWRLNFERGRCWLLPRGVDAMPRMRDVLVLMQEKRWQSGDWRIDARAATRWFIRKSKLGGMV
ncbi:MAG: cell division protein FtsQ/DivIB [Mariprofundaceae bacterium]|nr:cell division protein FtsQ/DivIB [Mariprofundaceae bacterium]